jgi:DNA polymerase I-like protein with 3'-5' exonuclease and polymerase domains
MDMKRAFTLLEKLPEPEVHTLEQIKADIKCFDGSKDTDLPNVLELLGEAMKAHRVSIDYETEGLRPYAAGAAVLSCALSYEHQGKHKTFSFAIDHPKSGWKGTPRMTVLNKLRNLISDDVLKIAHNTPFEVEWSIFLFGKEVVNHAAWEDPMMQAQFIDERRGTQVRDQDDRKAAYQSLDFLVKKYFGISIKAPFKLNKKHMSESPLPEMLLYNGVDAKYTLLLHKRQYDDILDDDVLDAYFEAVPRQPTVALMQYFGMRVDGEKVFAHQFHLADEIDEIIGKIAELKVIKQYIKDHKSFNPASNQEVLTIFRDYLNRPEIVVVPKHHEVHTFDRPSLGKKKWDEEPKAPKQSVDKGVLQQIDHPLAALILELRERTKLKSTYVDVMAKTPLLPDGSPTITCEKANGSVVNETFVGGTGNVIYPDGRLHTTYNCTFPETGRLSSDSPNLQNFPKRAHAEIRDQVSADPGCVLVAVDYGQLEWATTAICTRDKVIVKANWDEYDVHMEWAEKIARAYPKMIGGIEFMKDKEVMKKFRSLVKNKMVFPVIFGARNESVRSYLTTATGVDFPEKICNAILEEFDDTFSGLRTWQAATLRSYHERGYVESPTGRRHYYPLTPNQIINQPIQSVAADIVCDGMNRLSYMACTTGNWYLHPRLNVHDDLTFNVPDDEKVLEEAVQTIYKAMLTPSYDFINIPLSVEIAVGPNWFELESLGKFWSHRDL